MPPLPLALPPQSNQGNTPHSGVAELVNMFLAVGGEEQKTRATLKAVAGLDSIVTLPSVTGGVRALKEVDGAMIAVVARTVQQIDARGNATLLGGFAADGYVGIDRNQRGTGVQTIIAGGGRAAIASGGSLTRISDSDLPPPVDVTVVNRSAIFGAADGRMARSDVDDASAIDGLDVAVAEAVPDGLYRVVGRGSDILPIGPRSTEVWRDVGGETFGFVRVSTNNVGAVGPSSVVKATILGQNILDVVAFCAQDKDGRSAGVALMASDTPQKISTPYIDRLIDQVSDKSAIVATSWVERGRGFIAWRLTDTTIVYDTATQLWHERRSRDSRGDLTAWKIGHCSVLDGRVMAGHISSPVLYWLDPDVMDEDGEELICRVRTPPLSSFPDDMELNRVWLDVVAGTALVSGGTQDTTPVISMRMSRDGQTWMSSRPAPLGRQGQTGTRVVWNRCGTHPQVTFEWSCSASIVRELLQAQWDGRTIPA